MVFVACGLNHKTAPIDVREKVALSAAAHDSLLQDLLSLPDIQEAMILSTCNRTELYCETPYPEKISHWIAEKHQLQADALNPFLYLHQNEEALLHALRVASGLDSMMLGEPQILGQMKQAYQQALKIGAIQTTLRSVFDSIFSAAKRIRTQSGIGNNPVSVAYAAVQLLTAQYPEVKDLQVLLIGSGETAALVTKYLYQQGISRFLIANRTPDKAKDLAARFGGTTIPINDLSKHLSKADVVVSATACPIPFITKNLVELALIKRQQKPMFLLDLAVPRDIEEEVRSLPGVQLYNVDDLHTMTEKGLTERREAALHAEQLIVDELQKHLRKHRTLKAKEVICDYRHQMQNIAQKELKRALTKLSAGQCQTLVLNEFSERLVNKLTHNPTAGLRHIAQDGREDLFTLAQYLFNTQNKQNLL